MSKDNIRKITRVGRSRSMSVVIPADIIRSLGWREKQRVMVKRVPRGIMIIDAKSKKKKLRNFSFAKLRN